MVAVEKIEHSSFAKIYPLLQEFEHSLSESSWNQLFENSWNQAEGYCGFGLFEGDEIVGFLGTIFSDRQIGNRTEKICNLTSWIIKDSYRNQAVFMLFSVVRKLQGYTITDFTPSRAVWQISKRLGFADLDLKLKILIPYISLGQVFKEKNFVFTREIDKMEQVLQGSSLQIMSDHQTAPCKQLAIWHPSNLEEYCHIIYSRVTEYKIPYCHIHYISNPKMFLQLDSLIRLNLLFHERNPLIVVDCRLVKGFPLSFSLTLPFKSIRLYKSTKLAPEEIDNLYSELVLLNLSTIPSRRRIWSDFLEEFSLWRRGSKVEITQ